MESSTTHSSAAVRASAWWASTSKLSGASARPASARAQHRARPGRRPARWWPRRSRPPRAPSRTPSSCAGVRRHLEVEAGLAAPATRSWTAPQSRDHDTVEAPLVAQHLGEQEVVLAGVGAVDLVVGAHDRPRLARRDRPSEAAQVDLAQRPLVDLRVAPHRSVSWLLAAKCFTEVPTPWLWMPLTSALASSPATSGSSAKYSKLRPHSGERLMFDARAEQDADAQRAALLAERGADLLQQVGVPGGRQPDGRREAGGRDGVVDADVVGRRRPACARRAARPSASSRAVSPASSMAWVFQKSAPPVRAILALMSVMVGGSSVLLGSLRVSTGSTSGVTWSVDVTGLGDSGEPEGARLGNATELLVHPDDAEALARSRRPIRSCPSATRRGSRARRRPRPSPRGRRRGGGAGSRSGPGRRRSRWRRAGRRRPRRSP